MTVINEPTTDNISEEVRNSNTLTLEKIITKEKRMSFRAKCKKLDDEDSFCFVRGYN
jgi:hypothetical protein